jgi:hypothetical protein
MDALSVERRFSAKVGRPLTEPQTAARIEPQTAARMP